MSKSKSASSPFLVILLFIVLFWCEESVPPAQVVFGELSVAGGEPSGIESSNSRDLVFEKEDDENGSRTLFKTGDLLFESPPAIVLDFHDGRPTDRERSLFFLCEPPRAALC